MKGGQTLKINWIFLNQINIKVITSISFYLQTHNIDSHLDPLESHGPIISEKRLYDRTIKHKHTTNSKIYQKFIYSSTVFKLI